ncbi:MAG TPA: hypothetical protein VF669_06600 [Tepidisphaeraceae bacterium]
MMQPCQVRLVGEQVKPAPASAPGSQANRQDRHFITTDEWRAMRDRWGSPRW